MSALPPRPPAPGTSDARLSEYLVSYGRSGAFGRFACPFPFSLPRGARVVIETPRGIELGTVLCPATTTHARLLISGAIGRLVRPAADADAAASQAADAAARELLQRCTGVVRQLSLPLEILDAEILLDGRRAIVQYLGPQDVDISPVADALAGDDRLVLFENLAVAAPTADEDAHAGCDKPDCGRTNGAGGCTSCGTGGGCSSCGSGKVDMRAYFAHLRGQMEARGRVPLA
jgi:hypothetical protein